MFVRKKKNKSGVVSVQIIDKSSGKYKMIKTIGSSSLKEEVDNLVNEGNLYIQEALGQGTINFDVEDFGKQFIENINSIDVMGVRLLLEKIYDEIGYDQMGAEIFKI
jgi:hypothetical protein